MKAHPLHNTGLRPVWSSLWFALKPKPTGVRHLPSGLAYDRWLPTRDLDRYVDNVLERIGEVRRRLEPDIDDDVIVGNAPFRLPAHGGGERRAVLMVHGLTDSSFVTRDLADFFNAQGFEVLSLLLPGHGTCPGDLLGVTWRDWLSALREAIDALSASKATVYVCGFSLGATLGLYQALLDPRVAGLFLFAPALQLPGVVRFAHGLHGISGWLPHLRWIDVQPDEDPYKYESMATGAVVQTAQLVEQLRQLRRLRAIRIPLFVAASEDDLTVIGSASLEFFKGAASELKRMLYFTRNAPEVPEQVRLIYSRIPERHIVSAAHTSLIVSPENPHYGEHGDYCFCTHYYRTDHGDYERCKARHEDYLGEIGQQVEPHHILRRLTFNPWWEETLDEVKSFIARLPETRVGVAATG